MRADDTAKHRSENDTATGGSADSDGLGPDGTIPGSAEGVGVGASTEPNTFEPEEDFEPAAGATDGTKATPVDPSEQS
jgi:hypothetical protein